MINYMKKRIVLCADDYGQAPAISQGILSLVKDGRLSAVSCLVTTPYWREHASWLQVYGANIDIGLHFNLTEGKMPLWKLMSKSLLRRLNTRQLEDELNAQIDQFIGEIGRQPDFIDGHQHVHQFPQIRDALMRIYTQRFKEKKPYIRLSAFPGYYLSIKKAIVQCMGAKALTRSLTKEKIKFNQSFSGMYAFARASDYPVLFRTFLQEVGEGGLIMCHPGMPSSIPSDPIATARYFEYQYLSSLRFKLDCDHAGVTLSRFEDCIV